MDANLSTTLTIEFVVDGTAIPEVDFDVGESYAGSIPVTTEADGDSLFFWFFPSTNEDADKEILIWLNGGVGFLFFFSFSNFHLPVVEVRLAILEPYAHNILAWLLLFRGSPTGKWSVPVAIRNI